MLDLVTMMSSLPLTFEVLKSLKTSPKVDQITTAQGCLITAQGGHQQYGMNLRKNAHLTAISLLRIPSHGPPSSQLTLHTSRHYQCKDA